MNFKQLFTFLALVVGFTSANAAIYCVSKIGSDANSGNSWAYPKLTLQAGINAASAGDQVWVSKGVYKESITLKSGVQLFGSFIGNEFFVTQRVLPPTSTIIDAQGAYNAVYAFSNLLSSTSLDGFAITNAINGVYTNSSIQIRNNHFINLYTGLNGYSATGVFANNSSPTITNNVFYNIHSTSSLGEAIYMRGNGIISSNRIFNCDAGVQLNNCSATVSNNFFAISQYGLILFGYDVNGHDPQTMNNTFYDCGVGLSYNGDFPLIANSIFHSNGTAVECTSGASGMAAINSCCFYNNNLNYSNTSPGSSVINADPLFASPSTNDFRLLNGSPCIDAGLSSAAVTAYGDANGNNRIYNSSVDIGAYEWTGNTIPNGRQIVFVAANGDDSNDGLSWSSPKQTIQGAIETVYQQGAEVWVKAGVYKENLFLPSFVSLYGGFNGTETIRTQRNVRQNPTVLEYKLDYNSTFSGIYGIGFDRTPQTISGFLIRNYEHGFNLTNANLDITNNQISNCQWACNLPNFSGRLYSNIAVGNGAGFILDSSSCVVVNNTAVSNKYYGFNAYLDGTSKFENNLSAFNNVFGFELTIKHNAVIEGYNNAYGNGGQSYYGNVKSGSDLTVDPKLAGPKFGSVHLQPGSGCINAGDNSASIAGSQDMDGQARIQGGRVDIGADESSGAVWPTIPTIHFVSTSGSDINDGLSWSTPKRTIQATLNSLSFEGAEVWVKTGTYAEQVQMHAFQFLYGGFAGSETQRNQRNPLYNGTVIDTQSILAPSAIYSYPVRIDQVAKDCGRFDGFIIDHAPSYSIYNYDADITIANNSIFYSGGGICTVFSSASIINNQIHDCNGTGAPIYISGTVIGSIPPKAIAANNLIYSNTTTDTGGNLTFGGIIAQSSNTTISNNVLYYNVGTHSGIVVTGNNEKVYNNIVVANYDGVYQDVGLSNNKFGSNCLYQNYPSNYNNAPPGAGDLISDPKFVNAFGSDFHLQSTSPCINTGFNNGVPAEVQTDLDGGYRISGVRVDRGAYEVQEPSVSVNGTIKLQGWIGTGRPMGHLSYDGYEPQNVIITPTTAGMGTFTCQIPATTGFHGLRFWADGFLSQTNSVNVVGTISTSYLGPNNNGLIPGDINSDNIIDDTDMLAVINNFLSNTQLEADLNGDGVVDDTDLLDVINNFLSTGS